MTKEGKKKQFRCNSLKRLKRASGFGSYQKDKKIVEVLYRYIVQSNARTVMLYIPLKMEVNLYPLIERLRKEKRLLYVPFMEGTSFRLVKYRLPLKKKKFGIQEPNDSKQYRVKNIDLAIVPIVGIDSTYRRVGFGKGMYDRFYEKQSQNIKQTIFVARELCYSKEIVTDDHDVKADMIVTS
ncbi:MAG: 5-formyltetrahydrofolate cyclo-ligase [Epsilonproteobacteria bacterium]|nr:MAG: 5-formyltetrahydrofolate cyclo-ligase [Campylobacterota bacterium]